MEQMTVVALIHKEEAYKQIKPDVFLSSMARLFEQIPPQYKHSASLEISNSSNGWDNEIEFSFIYERPKTLEEIVEAEEHESRKKSLIEREEIATYLALKAKYEMKQR